MIVNSILQPSLETQPSLFSHSDNRLAKSIIKFVDIVLSLYAFVPFEVRNEMRMLQSVLLHKTENKLDEYIEQLESKSKLKEVVKRAHTSVMRTEKDGLSDSDKENTPNSTNVKGNVSSNSRKYENSLTSTDGERKVSRF
jgi:hypothetical protein